MSPLASGLTFKVGDLIRLADGRERTNLMMTKLIDTGAARRSVVASDVCILMGLHNLLGGIWIAHVMRSADAALGWVELKNIALV